MSNIPKEVQEKIRDKSNSIHLAGLIETSCYRMGAEYGYNLAQAENARLIGLLEKEVKERAYSIDGGWKNPDTAWQQYMTQNGLSEQK
jgi:hypothetical protein